MPPADEAALREKAREALRTGTLPSRRPDRTWGGRGVGADCTICSRPVTPDELEFEVEFTGDGHGGPDTYHFHIQCFTVWSSELETVGSSPASPANGPHHDPVLDSRCR
jgi:hypothetical protein